MVKDSGIGIPKEFLPKIFERFAQANSEAISQYKGTGLGTTISKQLVEAMGGRIEVESTLTVGTTFWFDLPLRPASERPTLLSASDELQRLMKQNLAARKKIRILIAEDDRTNQLIIAKLLEKAGFEFDLASDGESALDMLVKKNYDVALLDMQMPGLSGIEVCEAYKMIKRTNSNTMFIMLSANADQKTKGAASNAGFTECLSKPIESGRLLSLLDKMTAFKGVATCHANSHKDSKGNTNELNSLSIIDESVISELALISPASSFLKEVIVSFDHETAKNLNAITVNLRGGNTASLRACLHAIQGIAANVGAVSLEKAMSDLLGMVASEMREQLQQLLPELNKLHRQSVELLTDVVDEMAAQNWPVEKA